MSHTISLAHARAHMMDTTLDEETYRSAFVAWDRVVEDVVEGWNHFADPANLIPSVPAVMRRAAQLIRDYATYLETEEIDRLIEAIEAPYPERILRMFRSAMAEGNHSEQVKRVAELVNSLGLEPPPPPSPLPEISRDDVHLVCWIAIVP